MMSLRRMECVLVFLPLFALLELSVFEIPQSPSRIGISIWLICLAAVATYLDSTKLDEDSKQRRGAPRGLLIGSVILPLVFSSSLGHSMNHPRLIVMTLICSTMGYLAAVFQSRLHELLAWACLVFVASWHRLSFLVQCYQFSVVPCVLFVFIRYFLLNTLSYSFTEGEGVTIASLMTLLLSHAMTNSWQRLLADYLIGKEYLEWTKTMTAINPQTRSYYSAVQGLLVGVLLLGVVWMPIALIAKHERTHWKGKGKAKVKVNKEKEKEKAKDVIKSDTANGHAILSKVNVQPATVNTRSLSKRRIVRVTPAAATQHTNGSHSFPTPPRLSGPPSSSSPPSAPSAKVSTPTSHVWFFLLAFIVIVVYPFLCSEMRCEPFTFVWEYLVVVPTSDRNVLPETCAAPTTAAETAAATKAAAGLQAWTAYNIDFMSRRLLVAGYWIVIMVIGIFAWAPAGKAPQQMHIQEGETNRKADSSASSSSSSSSSVSSLSTPITIVGHADQKSNSMANSVSSATSSSLVIETSTTTTTITKVSSIPNILVRKYYHFLAVLMFLPAILLEPGFVGLSFSVALSIFVLFEYIRIARVPPIGEGVHHFMQTYLDARDSGAIILTHSYLLLGCALPLWFHISVIQSQDPSVLATAADAKFAQQRSMVWDMNLYIPALSGVLILGVGDSMASLIGVYFGRHRWFSSSRTIEGTLAAILSILGVVFALVQTIEWINVTWYASKYVILAPSWMSFTLSTVLTCLLEASTQQIDNLYLPIYYYAVIMIGRRF